MLKGKVMLKNAIGFFLYYVVLYSTTTARNAHTGFLGEDGQEYSLATLSSALAAFG